MDLLMVIASLLFLLVAFFLCIAIYVRKMGSKLNNRPTLLSNLPPTTRFKLGKTITKEQEAFFETYGFLVFDQVAKKDEIQMIIDEMDKIQERFISEGRRTVFGVPLFYGKYKGRPFLQRFAFSSVFSDNIRNFVRDPRFEVIRKMVGEDARVGDGEKDGVVINRYINLPGSSYPKLGWHTDCLRDLFYGRMPVKMFNIGLHLDECAADNGGLRLIPKTHLQGFWSMLFRKTYFFSHDEDPEEIAVETKAGDLTVHDGRLWHRVAISTRTGDASLRRSMYVPYLTGPFEPKNEQSKTQLYHTIGHTIRQYNNPVKLTKKD